MRFRFLLLLATVLLVAAPLSAQNAGKTVLILYEGRDVPSNHARSDALQFRQLLGHFAVNVTVTSSENYRPAEMQGYDVAAFVGHSLKFAPSPVMMADVAKRTSTFIWISTGIIEFNRQYSTDRLFGFTPVAVDTSSGFSAVHHNGATFTKEAPNVVVTRVTDPARCAVVATTSARRTTAPYLLHSGRFWYVADSPFAYATEQDRYLFFADILHDILEEDHPASHRALLRIEDVNPMEDPDRLRRLADILSSEDVPFEVGLTPIYVDPASGLRVTMSDKPDMVDAIHYMVRHGATVVMHGATHQYKGVTAADYEFWDANRNAPIKDESFDGIRGKIAMGLEELIRNGIYPVMWETPHYTGSIISYQAAASIFSTAMEQRLVINDPDHSQYFPYIITRDMYGQTLIPENLGYIPYDPDDPQLSVDQVTSILEYARTNLHVRDGFASCFFHSFVAPENLTRLVRGIKEMGYTYIDPKDFSNSVRLRDKAILTGCGSVQVTLEAQYLREYVIDRQGRIVSTTTSPERITGTVTKDYALEDGQILFLTPTEVHDRSVGFFEGLKRRFLKVWRTLFPEKLERHEARVAVLWDSTLTGGGMLDQQSFLNAFRVVSIPVDTLHVTGNAPFGHYTLIIAPGASVEKLTDARFSAIIEWVRAGGHCITDEKSEFSTELGIRHTGATVPVSRIRDRIHPDESLEWRSPAPFMKFEVHDDDEVFASDDETEAPLVIGRRFGSGGFLYFGCRFDPESDAGFSRFPFIVEYVRQFMHLQPVLRRDALELYFDPGYRGTYSVEDLVKRWAANGVRAIHAAAWHFYPKFTYDYARLIELCHANGILVYAWIEPPQVSQQFWLLHPEWREKSFDGNDARPSWRYPMAMTEPACLDAMCADYESFLRRLDFDGVNFGEAYFESGVGGPEEPKHLTPMHPSARTRFRAMHGFDPASLLDPASPWFWKRNATAWMAFEDWRVDRMVEVNRRLLEIGERLRAARPGFDVLITMLDNLGSPELRRSQAVDMERIIALRRDHRFTLIVEDPMARWSEDPRRYERIAAQYRGLVGNDFGLDLNILSFRQPDKPTRFPTLIQTGTEAMMLMAVTSTLTDRVLTYAESSINPQDFPLLAHAAAGMARLEHIDGGYRVISPVSVALQLGDTHPVILLDGQIKTAVADGRFLIPAGEHTVILDPQENAFSTDQLKASIVSITANLLYEAGDDRSITFGYETGTRCLVAINKEPLSLFVDGVETPLQVMKGHDRFSVMLPTGRHDVRMVTQSTVSYGVNLTSLLSSSLIVVFGALAVSVLAAFWLVVRIQRRRPLHAA